METDTANMNAEQENLILAALCGFIVLLSLLGLGWTVFAGQLLTFDGLLLALICLSLGGVFSLMILLIAKNAGWMERLPLPRRKSPEPPANDSA